MTKRVWFYKFAHDELIQSVVINIAVNKDQMFYKNIPVDIIYCSKVQFSNNQNQSGKFLSNVNGFPLHLSV